MDTLPPLVDVETLLAAIGPTAEALAAAATAAGLDAAVPSCPGWTAWKVLDHTGQIHRWAAGNVRDGSPPPFKSLGHAPEGDEAVAWYLAGAEELLAAFASSPLGRETWSFVGPRDVGWWVRRQAHEVTMHAVDASLAAGARFAIDPALAADGIDELLAVVAPLARPAEMLQGREIAAAPEGTLHVHCTDTEGEWLVQSGPDGYHVTREHAKGDAALRGPAADLLERLYGRGDGGEVLGAPAVYDAWRATLAF